MITCITEMVAFDNFSQLKELDNLIIFIRTGINHQSTKM